RSRSGLIRMEELEDALGIPRPRHLGSRAPESRLISGEAAIENGSDRPGEAGVVAGSEELAGFSGNDDFLEPADRGRRDGAQRPDRPRGDRASGDLGEGKADGVAGREPESNALLGDVAIEPQDRRRRGTLAGRALEITGVGKDFADDRDPRAGVRGDARRGFEQRGDAL